MPKFIVQFIQVSEHRVGAIVEAKDEEEAKTKARAGDNIAEFDLSDPESMELKRFFAKEATEEQANDWLERQKERYMRENEL